ncbi:hypothetical protein FACS1894152_6750 [Bacilli bacterium]|nr:hypothetical protein FACS1894152_6750 [Bacilli bacterium]
MGKPMKICVKDKLLLTLEYLMGGGTFYQMGISYNVNETTILRVTHWVKSVLAREEFKLPEKREN